VEEREKLPRWVVMWFGLSTIVVVWDALFVLCRPASFPGGEWAFLWEFAYTTYLAVDRSYADVTNHTVAALSFVSLLEACGVAVMLRANAIGRGRIALLLAVVLGSLTGAKTVLFFLIEAFSGFAFIGHNAVVPLMAFYVIPNGLWIGMPFFIAFRMGGRFLE
jgi:hypothetical protein